jgi:hypothetical protein
MKWKLGLVDLSSRVQWLQFMEIKVFTAISNQTNSVGSHNSSHPKLPKGGTPTDICLFIALVAKPKLGLGLVVLQYSIQSLLQT